MTYLTCAPVKKETEGETTTRALPNCIRYGDSVIVKKRGEGARRGGLGVGGSRDITIQNVQLQTGDRLLHLFSHNSCPASNRRQGMGKRKGKAREK